MEWFKKYQYLLLSGLAGAILACFILSYGFFKTLFVLICATLGVKCRKKSRRSKRRIDL
ncbi:DUF2273 domain-containing protein [Streptococcus thermophilus]